MKNLYYLSCSRVLVNAENGQTTANLIRNEFLSNRVHYALNRATRVKAIVDDALSAFKSSIIPIPEENSPISLKSSKAKKKTIDIAVEGRIKWVNE